MPTPFEAGKTAEELGIDTSREFVVMATTQRDVLAGFSCGDIVKFCSDKRSLIPCFTNKQGVEWSMYWYQLAYADDKAKPEPYQPRVGDKVRLEGEVVKKYENGAVQVEINGAIIRFEIDGTPIVIIDQEDCSHLTLLSRKTRTLTKAEAEALLTEKLGESVEIE